MNERDKKNTGRESYRERNNPKGHYITEAHIKLLDVFFTIVIALTGLFGGVLTSDAQFRWSGIFIILGVITTGVCWGFIHFRHRILNKRVPATITLTIFTGTIVAFLSIGASEWWFIRFKDSDNFNAVAGARITSSMLTDSTPVTKFIGISFMGKEDILWPISQLIYLQVTNKQTVNSDIVGISLDSSNNSGFWSIIWPSWTKLCPVNLRSTELAWLDDKNQAIVMGREALLETKISGGPLPPAGTVSGWAAWECPRDVDCNSSDIRMGISDAAGSVTWMTIREPSVSPDLMRSEMRPLPPIDISNTPLRVLSSCHAKK